MSHAKRAGMALYCAGIGLLVLVASSYASSLAGILGGLVLCLLAFVLALA